jgi:hypothetical protein
MAYEWEALPRSWRRFSLSFFCFFRCFLVATFFFLYTTFTPMGRAGGYSACDRTTRASTASAPSL